ncbi:hypothetical protein QOT17_25640 [Balamuthia mandrillaris]
MTREMVRLFINLILGFSERDTRRQAEAKVQGSEGASTKRKRAGHPTILQNLQHRCSIPKRLLVSPSPSPYLCLFLLCYLLLYSFFWSCCFCVGFPLHRPLLLCPLFSFSCCVFSLFVHPLLAFAHKPVVVSPPRAFALPSAQSASSIIYPQNEGKKRIEEPKDTYSNFSGNATIGTGEKCILC